MRLLRQEGAEVQLVGKVYAEALEAARNVVDQDKNAYVQHINFGLVHHRLSDGLIACDPAFWCYLMITS